MRVAFDDEAFLAAPVGTCVVDPGFVFAIPDPRLYVTVLRGRPDDAAIRRLVALWRVELGGRHASLFDAFALEGVEPAAFAVMAEEMRTRHEALARTVVRQAIVKPHGFPGAVVAGYRAVFTFPFPVELFDDRVRALGWLGRDDAAPLVAEAEALLGGDDLIVALRALLATASALKIGEAARRLGVSERSLQRRLLDSSSSYRAEVLAARVATARRLLVDTDEKLTAVALEVGCATPQSFSAMFRRATGETPSAYRARHRR